MFPAQHPYGSGYSGTAHGADCSATDPESALTLAAKFFCCVSYALLKDGGAAANAIYAQRKTPYGSVKEYLEDLNAMFADIDGVSYTENGAVLRW